MQPPLGNRQAIGVRPHATIKHRIAVDTQMVRGDGCCQRLTRCRHEIHGILGGDVLKHNLQRRLVFHQRRQHLINKHRFAIKNINFRRHHFAVDQKWHTDFLHPLQNTREVRNVGDASC